MTTAARRELSYKDTNIVLVIGDIAEQKADAIVNAANAQLAGGSGVDGAIHAKGGPSIMAACRERMKARDGQALSAGDVEATEAGDLAAKWVFHAVGPVWHGGARGELTALERAYRTCLELAKAKGAKTIAFPSISTGAYGFPTDRASFIAGNALARFCEVHPGAIDEVRLVLFSQSDFDTYWATFENVFETMIGTPIDVD